MGGTIYFGGFHKSFKGESSSGHLGGQPLKFKRLGHLFPPLFWGTRVKFGGETPCWGDLGKNFFDAPKKGVIQYIFLSRAQYKGGDYTTTKTPIGEHGKLPPGERGPPRKHSGWGLSPENTRGRGGGLP